MRINLNFKTQKNEKQKRRVRGPQKEGLRAV
jgi:hypothetical protein